VERTWFFVPFYESGCSGFKLVETSFFFFLYIHLPAFSFLLILVGKIDPPAHFIRFHRLNIKINIYTHTHVCTV
jgi:hypothetical protein